MFWNIMQVTKVQVATPLITEMPFKSSDNLDQGLKKKLRRLDGLEVSVENDTIASDAGGFFHEASQRLMDLWSYFFTFICLFSCSIKCKWNNLCCFWFNAVWYMELMVWEMKMLETFEWGFHFLNLLFVHLSLNIEVSSSSNSGVFFY